MRKLILGLMSAAYVCLGLIVTLLVWRNGGGAGAGIASGLGTIALLIAVHGLVERSIDNAALRDETAALREAHMILLAQIEKSDARLSEVARAITDESERRTEELTGEVHALEDIIQQMSQRLEDELSYHVEAAQEERGGGSRHPSNALLDTVREAFVAGRVDLYLQPVVNLPQRRTMFYESFSRLRDDSGRVMMPAEYLSVAEPSGLVTAIDNLLLFRCVQIVRRQAKLDRKVGIFCNISLASLGDDEFFPQFLEFMTANKDLGGALIFELGQRAFDARGSVEARNMSKLADLGFRFSLDKVTDLDLDFQDMVRADVQYVKIAAETMLTGLEELDGQLVFSAMPDLAASDFAGLCRRHGIDLIAEKVESERQVVDILELDIGFGQGHLFGQPRAISEAVLAETAPPPAFLQSSLQRRVASR